MKLTSIRTAVPTPKKAYNTPKLNVLGNVKKLTLKIGSAADGIGSFGG